LVSRGSEDLVRRLFEQEVPEIYDATVEIRSCAREAGERTKIAVLSHDRDVDAVGACVGMKGMRVQSIIRELRGEKIDIIEYSDDPIDMATRALSPAKISRVSIIDSSERHLEVVVDDMQLSLAIGKKGQNVRLAAKLMGWRIDIKSEEEKRQEVESEMAAMVGAGTPVSILIEHGLSDKLVDKLLESDVNTVERLADMTPEQLEVIPGIGPKMVEKIQVAVNGYYSQFEQPQQGPAQEAPALAEEPAIVAAAGAEALPAAPTTMPGLPVEGADADEGDTSIDDEDFDNMDLSSSDEIEEFDESDPASEAQIAPSATAALGSENAIGDAPPEPVVDTVGVEDEEMTS
jgi:N utilization substance protein A